MKKMEFIAIGICIAIAMLTTACTSQYFYRTADFGAVPAPRLNYGNSAGTFHNGNPHQ
jgi:hypothetical protein